MNQSNVPFKVTIEITQLEAKVCEAGNQVDFEPFGWTPLQIATYAINCPKEEKYFEEVAHMIERYADTKIWQELELPSLMHHK